MFCHLQAEGFVKIKRCFLDARELYPHRPCSSSLPPGIGEPGCDLFLPLLLITSVGNFTPVGTGALRDRTSVKTREPSSSGPVAGRCRTPPRASLRSPPAGMASVLNGLLIKHVIEKYFLSVPLKQVGGHRSAVGPSRPQATPARPSS